MPDPIEGLRPYGALRLSGKDVSVIYLLDLNYTLVANSPKRRDPPIRPFIRQIEQEAYRQWLIELLRPTR
ncbi:MAG: hypothetical protein ACPG3X_04575 [Opitutales bacterium]